MTRSLLSPALTLLIAALLGPAPAAAQPLDSAPPAGIDADLAAALDDANLQMAQGDLSAAVRAVLRLNLAPDRFSVAQRDRFRGPSATLLRTAARQALGKGAVEDAAVAFDGAWLLEGRPKDPEYAGALLQWAQKDSTPKGQALYLTRRARQADPDNSLAADLDLKMSTNPGRLVGNVLFFTGIAAAAAAVLMLASPDLRAATLIAGGAGVLCVAGGLITVGIGSPAKPVSPPSLPALPEPR
jgi:hypothetical protein